MEHARKKIEFEVRSYKVWKWADSDKAHVIDPDGHETLVSTNRVPLTKETADKLILSVGADKYYFNKYHQTHENFRQRGLK